MSSLGFVLAASHLGKNISGPGQSLVVEVQTVKAKPLRLINLGVNESFHGVVVVDLVHGKFATLNHTDVLLVGQAGNSGDGLVVAGKDRKCSDLVIVIGLPVAGAEGREQQRFFLGKGLGDWRAKRRIYTGIDIARLCAAGESQGAGKQNADTELHDGQ